MDTSRPGLEILDRRKVAENAVFSVYLDHIREHDGAAEVLDYLVVEPKRRARGMVTGVSVLPLMEGRIGLLRVYRHPLGRLVWELPRGFIDPGESDEAAACRELEEETGLAATPEGLRSLGFIAPEAGLLAARIHLFFASDCVRRRVYAAAEPGHRQLEWFSPRELTRLLEYAEIEDPSTIIALYRGAVITEA